MSTHSQPRKRGLCGWMDGRLGSLGVVLGLLGVIAVLVAVILLVLSDRERSERQRDFALQDCQEENIRDEATRGDLTARIKLYDDIIAADARIEPLAPDLLKDYVQQRIEAYSNARTAAKLRLASIDGPEDCASIYG